MTDIETRGQERRGDEQGAGLDAWTAFMQRLLPRAAVVGPVLSVVAALFVAFDIQTLPGDLHWISEPEAFIGYCAAIFFPATWIVVGRSISVAAPRAGIAVTLLGLVGAIGWTNPFVSRLLSIDLVDYGYDPNEIDDVWDNPSLFSALAIPLAFMVFLVAIVAGVAVLKTRTAPAWAGVALIAFVPIFILAQAGYVAIRVTYPVATVLLLAGVVGVVAAARPSGRTPDRI